MNKVAAETGETFGRGMAAKYERMVFPEGAPKSERGPRNLITRPARLMEAGDWIVLQLCGEEKRNACAAGYKAIWDKGYPLKEFFKALNPRFENVIAEKMIEDIYPAGVRAGVAGGDCGQSRASSPAPPSPWAEWTRMSPCRRDGHQ